MEDSCLKQHDSKPSVEGLHSLDKAAVFSEYLIIYVQNCVLVVIMVANL